MRSAENAGRRLALLGKFLTECQTQALHYGSCVSQKNNVVKNECEKEFLALKDCIRQAAKKTKK